MDAIPIKDLEAAMPKSLDDIIKTNRDRAQLSLASEEEIKKLHKGDINESRALSVMRKVRIIKLTLNSGANSASAFYALGYISGDSWITSAISGILIDEGKTSGVVQTKNSVYQLEEMEQTEPPFELLTQVCVALREWGINARFDLGVAPFF